ncbi:MAG: hypothetical protein ACRC8M_13175 [Cetobacterium sp.]|uniref:hypothetical protein n=1 Tax=Cetobacterium sp. TaxID=2071632 RepID=UPI003F3D63DD
MVLKLKQVFILFIFASWWCLNFFFNLPDTSVPIVHNYELYKKWDEIFYQRWGFFAPAPDYNDRLYYIYTSNNNSNEFIVYEVFENLHKNRVNNYLKDDNLSTLDYIIHNTSSPIGDLLRESYEVYTLEGNCKNLNDEDCYRNYINSIRDDFNESPNILTLVNHAKMISKIKNLDNHTLQIIIGAEELPKFQDRYSSNFKHKSYPFFKSNLYNLKINKWEKYIE